MQERSSPVAATPPLKSKLRHQREPKQGNVDKVLLDLDGTENKTKLGANAFDEGPTLETNWPYRSS